MSKEEYAVEVENISKIYTLRNIFGVTLSSNTFWGNYRGRGRKMNFL